jgi:hypothetical protein
MSSISRKLITKSVTTAGTAVPLSATPLGFKVAFIQAKEGNTNNIYAGSSDVDSTNGIVLTALATMDLHGGDFSDIFIDSDTNGDGVNIFYEEV